MNINFQYQERLIDFVSLDVCHDEKKMLNLLLSILKFYEITKKLMTITIDNAFNNRILKQLLNLTMIEMSIS